MISSNSFRLPFLILTLGTLGACGSDSNESSELDNTLNNLINEMGLNDFPQRDLPNITDALPQLGKKLFFTKALGGDKDSACVTCHHPVLGGGDNLSLSVGVTSNNSDLLGLGRIHMSADEETLPSVPRNAPTVFNMGFWDKSLFHDSRVESLSSTPGTNGSGGDIRSPDTDFNVADENSGNNLTAAQARFPVTSQDEMRGFTFEADSSNDDVRDHLAARLGNYGVGLDELTTNDWLEEFQQAYASNDTAENLVTYSNIANAIAEYERSMQFASHPWQHFMDGDLDAISESAKKGARLFFTKPEEGGAGCVACHKGQLFTDENHHVVAYPQIGPGKGDGTSGTDDFGRFRETGLERDKYAFRTASLLNISVTGPFSHSGSMHDLEQVVRHYINPNQSIADFVANENNMGVCNLPQFKEMDDCSSIYQNAQSNSESALAKLVAQQNAGTSKIFKNLQLSDTQVNNLVAFLEALTDPCVKDRECLIPWIPEPSESVDNLQLDAVDINGELL